MTHSAAGGACPRFVHTKASPCGLRDKIATLRLVSTIMSSHSIAFDCLQILVGLNALSDNVKATRLTKHHERNNGVVVRSCESYGGDACIVIREPCLQMYDGALKGSAARVSAMGIPHCRWCVHQVPLVEKATWSRSSIIGACVEVKNISCDIITSFILTLELTS